LKGGRNFCGVIQRFFENISGMRRHRVGWDNICTCRAYNFCSGAGYFKCSVESEKVGG
jgi:hypothetical protein